MVIARNDEAIQSCSGFKKKETRSFRLPSHRHEAGMTAARSNGT